MTTTWRTLSFRPDSLHHTTPGSSHLVADLVSHEEAQLLETVSFSNLCCQKMRAHWTEPKLPSPPRLFLYSFYIHFSVVDLRLFVSPDLPNWYNTTRHLGAVCCVTEDIKLEMTYKKTEKLRDFAHVAKKGS